MMYNQSYYGGFRTRTFSDIFPDEDTFFDVCQETELFTDLFADETILRKLFYLLYAKYGNSHIKSSDETQFKYKLCSLIFQFGPTWEKQLANQKEIRALSIEDIRRGGKMIFNHANNPSTLPSTSTLEELTFINEQNTNNSIKGIAESYSLFDALLKDDVSDVFLTRFGVLFRTIVSPDEPLLYFQAEGDAYGL